jgi:hypothetical protein
VVKLGINIKAFLLVVLLVSSISSILWAASPVAQDNLDEGASILVLTDVPLMPGLEELVEEGVLFDKPDGRYVEINLLGRSLTFEAVHDFYGATMANLGWVKVGESTLISMHYTKDGEDLTMKLSDSEYGVIVKIRLKPIG